MAGTKREHALTVAGFVLVLLAAGSAWLLLAAVEKPGQTEFVQMHVYNVVGEEDADMYAVLLTNARTKPTLALPLFVGQSEAAAILRALNRIETPRPMTHDLLGRVIEKLGATVDKVSITRLEKGVFFAELSLKRGDETILIDARPSDSIAVAVRVGAPVFVARPVLDEAGQKITPEGVIPAPPKPKRKAPADAI